MNIEGPVYADRVNGRLTYLDWERWTPEDQARWPRPISSDEPPTQAQRLAQRQQGNARLKR
jgi:hypothetical protein